jgi:chromodomain-helicase-DNA-binding protein 4
MLITAIVDTENSIDLMIENAIQEASKPKETVTEASGLTFEFAQIWESSNPAEEGNELEVDSDFWAKMIAQAQEEKEKMAAQEVAESGRGAKRRAKAAVVCKVTLACSLINSNCLP